MLFSINDIDINEAVVSNKLPFSKQEYFISCKDYKEFKPFCIYFSKTTTYRSFDKNKYMYFLIKQEKLLMILITFGKKLAI